jgi:hypothetical protein
MALRKAVIVEVWAISDGVSTEFTLDLLKDPYWVGSHTTSGIGGVIQNWDTSLVNDVLSVEGAESMSISGTVVTITVPLKPEGYKHIVIFNVLFDPSVVLGPPVIVDAPYVSGPSGDQSAVVGDTINCTMGNWSNMQAEPHSYSYQWRTLDFNNDDQEADIVGATLSSYTVASTDNGLIVYCDVTATNTAGSTTQDSNGVMVS